MNKLCKFEFINTAYQNTKWCDNIEARCMSRSKCGIFKDGSDRKQEAYFALKCPKCGRTGHPNLEETGPHTKALCGECRSYIKMLSKEDLGVLITESYREVIKSKPISKRPILNRADALDVYIKIRDKINDVPVSPAVYKDSILNYLCTLAESHSAALSYIEELEREVSNDR